LPRLLELWISTDEKTSIQAGCRCHPTLPTGPGQTMRVEHESLRDLRKSALTNLAALDEDVRVAVELG
jgi:hypothetical protein